MAYLLNDESTMYDLRVLLKNMADIATVRSVFNTSTQTGSYDNNTAIQTPVAASSTVCQE
jgi:hypothetical protein